MGSRAPEKYRKYAIDWNRRQRYGLELGEYDAMMEACGGRCEACGGGPVNNFKSLDVDHCHRTGLVRGLLCQNCNRALGHVDDSVGRLLALVDYLRERGA